MMVDYAKVARGFDDAVRLLHGLQARQDDHARLMEAMMQTLSQVGAGLDALTDGVTRTVTTELSATRDLGGAISPAPTGSWPSGTPTRRAAVGLRASSRTAAKPEQMSARFRDDIGARIEKAVQGGRWSDGTLRRRSDGQRLRAGGCAVRAAQPAGAARGGHHGR